MIPTCLDVYANLELFGIDGISMEQAIKGDVEHPSPVHASKRTIAAQLSSMKRDVLR